MFESLSEKLQGVFRSLRGQGVLSEAQVEAALREIRLALLEADVHFKVARDFLDRVRPRATGADILKSLTPDQAVLRIVRDEMIATLGGTTPARFERAGKPPTIVLMAGLQGSGKTTTTAKLGKWLAGQGHHPLAVSTDVYRPAAREQLTSAGARAGLKVFRPASDAPLEIAKLALAEARAVGHDVLIVDTAGRLHVDEELMDELAAVRNAVKPTNVLLVLDSMTGQDAVNVAEAFAGRVAFDGVVLTKLDGDARGGAALSVKAVTGTPIKFASLGEKLDQLDVFHPDRMASRILGMGDVLTLIEKAEAATEQDEQEELERRLRSGRFTFDDFLKSYEMMRKLGPLQSVLGMIPGLGKQLQGVNVDDKALEWARAIVLSMTPEERRRPEIISGARRSRIARGSGTSVQQVNQLLNGRKQMEKMMKQMGRGKTPNIQSMAAQLRR